MNYPEELTSTYDIYEQIGAGGGGTVYRAVHKRLQKEVVLKRITGNSTNIQECRTEVDILKNLHHPYLPQVLDFIESPEGIYTVMDFIPGKSFRQMVDDGHKFTEKEVLKYARQLCEALDYLHSQNPPIIHGDIKPDNIMVTPEGNVCLIDFNISGILEGKGAQAFGYTPGFSAPEQVEGFEAARRRIARERRAAAQEAEEASRVALSSQSDEGLTILLSQDEDKTVMLSQDEGKTVLLSQGEGNTILRSQDDDRTVLLSQIGQEEQKKSVETPSTPQAGTVGTGIIINKRSDIFSLGATLYTLLTEKILDVKALNVEPPAISDGFWVILSKALERDPGRRYSDAGKMLQALLQVHKNNRRYKKLLRRQQIISALIIFLITFGIFFTVEGRRTMETEREDFYYELVAQMDEGIQSAMTQKEFEELYTRAVEMYPSYLDAYYGKARYLLQAGDYEVVIQYIDDVMGTPLESDDELWGNMYYLAGECYFRLENFQYAANSYQTSLTYQKENPAVYRDYAISLVYLGRVEEASQVLEEALLTGMGQVDVYMVSGEIARMTGDFQEALVNFENVLKGTDDEYLRQRAYIMGSKTYRDMGTTEALEQDVEWLQRGLTSLAMNNRLLLYERLAQDYIMLGENTLKNEYYVSAVGVFEQIKEMGWDTYMTYNNAVILCQRMGDLEQAEEWALKMQNRYPAHYVTYVRLAFLEVEKQNRKPNEERTYTDFNAYYQSAKEHYEQQMSGNVTDAEMLLLNNTWQQVADGGWLE